MQRQLMENVMIAAMLFGLLVYACLSYRLRDMRDPRAIVLGIGMISVGLAVLGGLSGAFDYHMPCYRIAYQSADIIGLLLTLPGVPCSG